MFTAIELADLLESWLLHLRAERKSPETVRTYATGVRQFLSYCTRADIPPALDRPTLNAFIATVLDGGAEGATALARQKGVRQFSAWLAEEGEIERDELLGIKPPKLDVKIVSPFSTEQLQALLAACKGKEFRDRRDEALVQLMLETGLRASEVVSMTVSGTDVPGGRAVIRRGKGGKGRIVPYSVQCGRALDRYRRARRTHRLAGTDVLWLGERGRGFGYYGLNGALRARARAAGVEGFHLHRMRHTGATRWLQAGGSEGGALAVFGWARRDQLDRYVAATAADMAVAEARELGLGEV
jgi:site-specific recombinase XerD